MIKQKYYLPSNLLVEWTINRRTKNMFTFQVLLHTSTQLIKGARGTE